MLLFTCITSHIYGKVVVVGSGYIGVELAGILKILGSSVSLVIRRDRVLRSFDDDLSDTLMKEMDTAGIDIIKNSSVSFTIL